MIHPRIDQLLDKVDSRYALVIIAAKRAPASFNRGTVFVLANAQEWLYVEPHGRSIRFTPRTSVSLRDPRQFTSQH